MPDEIKNEKPQAPNAGVTDKRSNPPGVMRKSLQSWVILIVAALMLLLIWLTGGTKAKTAAPQTQPVSTQPNNPTTPQDDFARRLLAQQREQQQSLMAQAANPANATFNPSVAPPPQAYMPTAEPQQLEKPEQIDPIAEDQRKRNYSSLFSSSVALSYREPQNKAPAQQPTPEQLAAAIVGLPLAPLPQPSTAGTELPTRSSIIESPPTAPNSEHHPAANPDQASGKNYTVFEGTFLETALVNRLDGDFSGPVICMLTNDVYSQDRQHLLIPAGSKLLGETKRVDAFGQRRLAVSFHRLIMPDGYSLDLDRFQGLNQIGETGLKDKVNNHYLQIFGASIAIGAIGGLAQLGTQTPMAGVPEPSADVYRQGVATSLSQSSLHVLDRFLNILPTVTIREGHRVKVYLTQDLLVPDYSQHLMPSNL